jgi:hypothetical protein
MDISIIVARSTVSPRLLLLLEKSSSIYFAVISAYTVQYYRTSFSV